MPRSEVHPGGIAMESIDSLDSAGSCDSVMSVNSGYSDDSLEHLSAEERACLMFLEETIESLELEEDSGLSNDEPESLPSHGNVAPKFGHLSSSKSKPDDVHKPPYNNSITERYSKDNKPTMNYMVPTPLVLPKNGSATLSSAGRGTESSAVSTNSETRLTETTGHSLGSPDPDHLDKKPKEEDKKPKNLVSDNKTFQGHFRNKSEISFEVIPPPSDFRDELVTVGNKKKLESDQTTKTLLRSDQPVENPDVAPSRPLSSESLDKLRQKAYLKKTPQNTPDLKDKPQSLSGLPVPDEKITVTSVHSDSRPHPTHLHDQAETKMGPPTVAPKPKKLPSNIVLKQHKASLPSQESNLLTGNEHFTSSSSPDKTTLDPQKVRMEALKKLGLLKDNLNDSGSTVNPAQSPKLRRSWETKSANPPNLSNEPKAQPAMPEIQEPRSRPQVARGYHQRSGSELPPVANRPSPARPAEVKSATLERSGMGLGSYMASQHADPSYNTRSFKASNKAPASPNQLRNSRPRPASLGTGKDFIEVQGNRTQTGKSTEPTEHETQRPLPPITQQHTANKLPRSQGISVQIMPKAKTEGDRKEALRKLGLLKE
nr:PREDICTED: specifically androgen-regulated gene protein isoform X1 [Lepisosteus oculatus]XP_015197665.1 PREDICTED: specifically androgen-regulated gene protein isoform X1 [Lepisosteus oculatus]XP_015197666.1 PREDICTED: specifically androgen-regulated gene protein isoform X1 [Lepisosteus oculatus]XP_015197667.1 PREDICTED: specifically androgen-regulated gene protein isoform X1 [Lepisosteus oculatus]XP_015197668.1 PREDICTED: specifically androgen-regulated gene protein isoform X1 [Lepisosteus 